MPDFPISDSMLGLIAERFKALSEPMRLKLLMALEKEERSVGDLVQDLGTSQANISKHLSLLTQKGVLQRRKEGLHVYYSVRDPGIFNLCQHVCGGIERGIDEQKNLFK